MKQIAMAILIAAGCVLAQDSTSFTVYPEKYGVRDYSAPGTRYDAQEGEIYQTIPGTNIKDWRQPALKIERDEEIKLPKIPNFSSAYPAEEERRPVEREHPVYTFYPTPPGEIDWTGVGFITMGVLLLGGCTAILIHEANKY
jgi:hypothetical protein